MKRLQRFDFKGSHYERPNQDWVCGRKDCGDACALGPDLKGNCRATAECRPRKDGARWFCTRADSRGGRCPDGPRPDGSCCRPVPPCAPRRSVRARRRMAVLLVSALTLGAVFVAAGHFDRAGFFSPGPLTAGHASGATNCALCHTAAQLSGREWLGGALAQSNTRSDSQLCLNCHNLGPQPASPHGLAPATLAALAKNTPARAVPATLVAHPAAKDDLACATCHQEHHGRDFKLAQLADASCQTCHAAQFASFAAGHPGFGDYPYARRTRIEFDHAAHIGKYFPAATKQAQAPPTQCNDCHTTGSDNRLMLVKGFAVTCAACHLEGITKPGSKGVAVLAIPGLDKKSLDAKTPGVGQWPADADGELTPFMRVLLASDEKTAVALATLKGADLTNLAAATPEMSAAAAQVAWGVKELVSDLLAGGHAALQKRLGASAPVAALGQLPPESVQAFTQPGWWPDLAAEVAAHRAGQPLPAASFPPATPAPAPAPAAAAPKPAATGDLLGDDLLGDAPKPAAPPPPAPKPAATDDLLGGDDLLAGPATSAPPKPAAPKPPATVAPEKWVSAGGWHISSADFSLRYKPAGHGDGFLQAWLDLAAARATPASSAVFNELAAATSCAKCHSVDAAPPRPGAAMAAALLVNWRAAAPAPQVHSFTKFSHGTHFALLDEKGCQTCHQLNAAAPYAAAFKDNRDPGKFASSFRPLTQAACARCHVPAQAGDSCLLCHNYHTGEFASARLGTFVKPAARPAAAAPAKN